MSTGTPPAAGAEHNVVYLRMAGDGGAAAGRTERGVQDPVPAMPLPMVRAPSAGPKLRIPAQAAPAWQLIYRGWTLKAPNKRSVPLTSGERTFLAALFGNPHRQLSYEDWKGFRADAEDEAYTVHSLTATVYRLRRKCALAGMRLPLRAEYGRGYQFIAPCVIEDGAFEPESRPEVAGAPVSRRTPFATGQC